MPGRAHFLLSSRDGCGSETKRLRRFGAQDPPAPPSRPGPAGNFAARTPSPPAELETSSPAANGAWPAAPPPGYPSPRQWAWAEQRAPPAAASGPRPGEPPLPLGPRTPHGAAAPRLGCRALSRAPGPAGAALPSPAQAGGVRRPGAKRPAQLPGAASHCSGGRAPGGGSCSPPHAGAALGLSPGTAVNASATEPGGRWGRPAPPAPFSRESRALALPPNSRRWFCFRKL